MDSEKTESYRALYRVRPLIYHIGDIRLWVPIRQDGIVLWIVYLFLFFFFCYLFPILAWIIPLDRTMTMAIGPIVAAYYTVKLDPAGKTAPKYLQDILHFLVRPKWIVRWQAIRQPGGKRKIHFWGRCRPYEIVPAKEGGEEWRGGMGTLRGEIIDLQKLLLPADVQVCWHERSKMLRISTMKGKQKGSVIPPAYVQQKAKQTSVWFTSDPVEVEVERDQQTHTERWKIEQRRDLLPWVREESRKEGSD